MTNHASDHSAAGGKSGSADVCQEALAFFERRDYAGAIVAFTEGLAAKR